MKKGIRATYIAARLINNRPEYESYEAFSRRVGLPCTLTVDGMIKRKDMSVGLLYRICKIFGYQIMIYNPNPPKGLDSIYVVGTGTSPINPREDKGMYSIKRDRYTGEIYRERKKNKKRKSKTFVKVET